MTPKKAVRAMHAGALIAAVAAVACSDTDKPASLQDFFQTPAQFTCTEERAEWTQCSGDRILECHVGGGDAHFDAAQDCAASALACAELTPDSAACVDPTASCSGEPDRCEDNRAMRCVDGQLVIDPCGTAKACMVVDGAAFCEGPDDDHHHDDGEAHGDDS